MEIIPVIEAGVAYLPKPRTHYDVSVVAELIDKYNVEGVVFGISKKIYTKEDTEGIKDWKEIKQTRTSFKYLNS